MSDRLVYVSRLVRLPLVGADGAEIGHMADVVLTPSGGGVPPQVNGFVVAVQRRRVFVGIGRVAEIEIDGEAGSTSGSSSCAPASSSSSASSFRSACGAAR